LPLLVVGRPLTDGPFHGGGAWHTVSPGYFDVFKIPVKRGRAFTDRDVAGSTPVVIVNEAMAKQIWPKGDPLQDQIWIGKGIMRELATETPRQVIGIVGDVRGDGLNENPSPAMYVPNAQVPDALNALNVSISPLSWIVRTRGNPMSLAASVQSNLREVTGLPVSEVRSMEEVISRSTSRQRFNMLLMVVFGGSALFLAAIGIYGLMAYSVQQRTQELGIRLALGAAPGQVRRLVLLQGMRLAVTGIVIGLGVAFGVTRVMTAFLYGVKERDLAVFSTVAGVLVLIALIAVWLPARRATRIDPVIALRSE
jgi:predicted permease